MGYNFRPLDREQQYLMPPSMRDWLPAGDLVWFLLEAVAQMELDEFYCMYRADGWGNAAYEPSMMVSLLLYAYCVGERSSRRIERLCERDIAFRLITGNQAPDHSTIARFRQGYEEALAALFTQVLRLCAEAGLVKAGVVALDGTKIKANASLAANRTYAWLEEEVRRMLSEAEAKDAEEDELYGPGRRGDELPEELKDPGERLARLRQAKERLEREAAGEAAQQAEKIEKRVEEEEKTGRKKRGRKPKELDDTPQAEAKANVTDPESRIMKTRTGYVQGYNAQVVVTKDQLILAADVTQEENDVRQLHPMLEQAQEELATVSVEEPIGVLLADAGYWSEANIQEADPEGPELLIATTKDWKQRKALREKGPPRGRIPKDLSLPERMERELRTKRGWGLYSQ
ncbi:MAG: IS1182 family transposase, partial [Chloroflexi bacterium]|nr:IS1182 family transposase [Chloroflexota bacterium]